MKKIFLITILIMLCISYTNVIHAATKKKKIAKSSNYPEKIIVDSILHAGVKYKNILFGSRANKISANILEIDLNHPELEVSVLKAKNNNIELDKLHNIINFRDDFDGRKTLGAINASFWRAYSNNPIGACIINGNIVEMNPYKEWSGIFFDKKGKPYIDNFKLNGSVRLHDGKIISISTVNRRRDSIGVVLYNTFGGDVIPHVMTGTIDKMITEAYEQLIQDSTFMNGDSTEAPFDFAEFERNIIENARADKMEGAITKALVEFIDTPTINKDIRAVVNFIDTGAVRVFNNQAVLSLGYNLPPDLVIYVGDTLTFSFNTNVHSDIEFINAAAATPRLVRNGIAKHEAYFEGSKSRRFINGQLGRTAIGYNKDKTKLYLTTIDHSNRTLKKKGASLGELAQIMKQLGAYDAMNLDGGGSSVMVVDGKNIMAKNRPEASRRISVAIGVRKVK